GAAPAWAVSRSTDRGCRRSWSFASFSPLLEPWCGLLDEPEARFTRGLPGRLTPETGEESARCFAAPLLLGEGIFRGGRRSQRQPHGRNARLEAEPHRAEEPILPTELAVW